MAPVHCIEESIGIELNETEKKSKRNQRGTKKADMRAHSSLMQLQKVNWQRNVVR